MCTGLMSGFGSHGRRHTIILTTIITSSIWRASRGVITKGKDGDASDNLTDRTICRAAYEHDATGSYQISITNAKRTRGLRPSHDKFSVREISRTVARDIPGVN